MLHFVLVQPYGSEMGCELRSPLGTLLFSAASSRTAQIGGSGSYIW